MACHTLQSQQCSLTECQLPCINSWDQSLSSPGKASLPRKHSWFFLTLITSSEQTHSNVSYCRHELGKFCFLSQQLMLQFYTSFMAIFKIWPQSTMSLLLLIHFPHSRTFCVQNTTYNSSTETGIQHSVGFAVINVQQFPPQKCSSLIYTLLFSSLSI